MSALEDFDTNDSGRLEKLQDFIVRTYMVITRSNFPLPFMFWIDLSEVRG